ncbi:hypothetical protein [Prochlorococcus marinus]|uniref:Uncharacterized protein n=1 Tax=Prochlorococcus marinus XMU1408 TaxID=2213228 RepID=A0A318R2C3_PROMR|nr:hypothetical protein [Prochlorococcus marinus]MBW3041847.1 hypothetical protein [Prochlorococcus marinus str. XMU1408]PYE02985.1 hypothetical protein DNJ73_04350 [Prochlorococcus marinus XMU1408]
MREQDLQKTQVEYLLNTTSNITEKNIDKYKVANYYYFIAKLFNQIAEKRNINRNQLWQIVKNNILFKTFNKTTIRIYKYIFRGELIPSPEFVKNLLEKYDDLPTYLAIVYLDEEITPELNKSYELLLSI